MFGNFSISQCWSQFRPEAANIVSTIRSAVAKAKPVLSNEASRLEQDLINHLDLHRRGNTCPNISQWGQHRYQRETKALVDRANRLSSRVDEELRKKREKEQKAREARERESRERKSRVPAKVVAAPTKEEVIVETQTVEAPGTSQIRSRLDQLRRAISLRKEREIARIKAVQEQHRKAAAYGRDTKQIRPKGAGYATESERIMGGRTGYGGFSAATLSQHSKKLDLITEEIKAASLLVKKIGRDVKKGVLPRSDLAKAMKELNTKVSEAKKLSSGLSGFASTPLLPKNAWILVLVIGLGVIARRSGIL